MVEKSQKRSPISASAESYGYFRPHLEVETVRSFQNYNADNTSQLSLLWPLCSSWLVISFSIHEMIWITSTSQGPNWIIGMPQPRKTRGLELHRSFIHGNRGARLVWPMASHTIPTKSHDSSTSSYSEPQPFVGIVENTIEAMHLVHAASKGIVPRTTRRLTTNVERRNLIKSGAVFIFSVKESGIKRWTDGRQWSASRVAGNFLVSDRPSCTPSDNTLSIS